MIYEWHQYVTKYFFIIDPCFPNPCKNGGECSKDGKGGYRCNCTTTGFNGPSCNIGNLKKINFHRNYFIFVLGYYISIYIADPCASKPCKNGGICSKDGKGGYSCDCTSTGFNGPACNIGNLKLKALIRINLA